MAPHDEHKEDLSAKFESFEYEPSDAVWRRVELEVEGDPQPGVLAASLGGYTHTPNAQVWDWIVSDTHPTRRRAAAFWWLATAASVALMLFVGWRFGRGDVQKSMSNGGTVVIADNGQGDRSVNGSGDGNLSGDNGASDISRSGDARRNLRKRFTGFRTLAEQGLSQLLFESPGRASGNRDEEDGPGELRRPGIRVPAFFGLASDTLPDPEKRKRNLQAVREDELQDFDKAWDELPDLRRGRSGKNSATLASTLSPSGSAFDAVPSLQSDLENGNDPRDGYLNQVPISFSESSYAEAARREDFSTPIVVGMQFRRQLSRRISLGAGPVYTLMNSVREVRDGDMRINESIRRQYLGLAISGNYAFVARRRFTSYLTLGTQLDAGLGARIIKRTFNGQTLTLRETLKDPLGTVLLANLGIGAGYRFTDQLGMYIQTSLLTSLFSNHANLWVSRQLWPGAQIGLRLDL